MRQDHLGRAEGYGIVHADEQYIVPTDGKPIRGLIQVGLRRFIQGLGELVRGAAQLCAGFLASPCVG